METCPWCDMDGQPELIKVENYNYSPERVQMIVQYRCPECRKIYKMEELFDFNYSEVIPEKGMIA